MFRVQTVRESSHLSQPTKPPSTVHQQDRVYCNYYNLIHDCRKPETRKQNVRRTASPPNMTFEMADLRGSVGWSGVLGCAGHSNRADTQQHATPRRARTALSRGEPVHRRVSSLIVITD